MSTSNRAFYQLMYFLIFLLEILILSSLINVHSKLFFVGLHTYFFSDFCPTLVSLTPEMNFRTLSASMINQESNSAAIIPLLTLKLSLVSTLVNHHTKNREKNTRNFVPGENFGDLVHIMFRVRPKAVVLLNKVGTSPELN